MEKMMTRDEMSKALAESVCEVKFVKKDGTERVMKCTTQMDSIPEDKRPKSTHHNTDVLNVFDLDKNDWRSFRVDSVQDFAVA
jgi:hypothetical protein